MKCAICGRRLRREPILVSGEPVGPVCAARMTGVRISNSKIKVDKAKAVRDDKTMDLFA